MAVAAAEAACGPRDIGFEVTANESHHPTPIPENGKALIYVVLVSDATSRVGADGKWLGALKGGTYFSTSIDPGEHHLCAIGHVGLYSPIALHKLKAEAGETYYFVAQVVGAVYPSEFDLRQADPDEGKYLVARAKLSTSHPK
jgi:hypothetical protein